MGADDRHSARPDDHVFQRRLAAGGARRDGESFSVPPTTVATGIVAYSMLVAGFVMLGAKLVQRYGAARVFRAAVVQPDRDDL